MNNSPALESTNQILTYIRKKGIAHLSVEQSSLKGNSIQVNSKQMTNFGSCSYLGLEFDDRLKNASIKAIQNFGTQFSSSKAYLSLNMYQTLESKLDQIFKGHTVVTPTTTLGHIAAIPVLVGEKDLVIMDHQVHNSVQTAVKIVKASGTEVQVVRHNRMDLLEEKIINDYANYSNIWYMADGIYSMYGDKAPVDRIFDLLEKYEKFHFYVDDAHAMSCFGSMGQGYVLEKKSIHERMVVATSLNKAFASGGGAFIFPKKEMAEKLKNCGGPMITSGPMQPSALGAAIAAADIHLSGEIQTLQNSLKENIRYTHLLLQKYGLPNLAEKDSPIFFVGVSLPKVGYNLVSRMMNAGHMVNIGIFPAVPMKNTGVRFTITRLHTFQQIEKMVGDLAELYFEVLEQEQFSLSQVYKAFKLTPPENISLENQIDRIINSDSLSVSVNKSIMDINKQDWDNNIGAEGIINWEGMNVLEQSFTQNTRKHENWCFDYLTIKDSNNRIIIQTFFTSGITKDDMLASKELSVDIEKLRNENEFFYTSKFLCLGSMISEGNHMFIDRSSEHWKKALELLFEEIEVLQKKYNATTTIIRDLPSDDEVMDNLMVDNGFFKSEMPENFSLDISNWNKNESYKTVLSKRSKRHFKENVERFSDDFITENILNPTKDQLDEFYRLYTNVHAQSLEINTFKLPQNFFKIASQNKDWEILNLKLKNEPKESVGAILLHKGHESVSGVIVGLDYSVNYEYNVYRQSIFQLIRRTKDLGYNKINFGFSAGIEKKKFGAVGHRSCAYMQVKDNFKFESLMAGTFRKEVKGEVALLD